MLDFPASPSIGSLFQSTNGSVWQWDGVKWAPQASGITPQPQTIGKNLLHNSMFNVAQRGTGNWTANAAYTADRWVMFLGTSTCTTTLNTLSDADRTGIGDEAARTRLRMQFVGTAGAGDFAMMAQYIEDVRRLANKTVTVSFWANAGAAGVKLGLSLDQFFGSGGSPSAPVTGNGQSVTLTTAWARYSLTFTLPSLSGLTLGTNGDDKTGLNFWLTSGTTNATRSGSVGVQSGTINTWGIQLEVGTQATPLEKPDPRYDLANCQRFYYSGQAEIMAYQVAGGLFGVTTAFPVVMRATPTVIPTWVTTNNVTGQGAQSFYPVSMRIFGNAVVTGQIDLAGTFGASADL